MPGFKVGGKGDGPPNTLELLRQHRWLIRDMGPISEDNRLVAQSITLPDLRIERQEILGGMLWYKFAKAVKFEDAQVTFYDTGEFLDDIEEWRKKIYTTGGGIQTHAPSSGYKMDCQFDMLDGTGITRNRYTLKNAWPAQISQGKLSYSDNEIKLVTITLAYDWAEFETLAASDVTNTPGGYES